MLCFHREFGRFANRIELSARFVEGSVDVNSTRRALGEAIDTTFQFLNQIDLDWLHSEFTRVTTGMDRSQPVHSDRIVFERNEFLASLCDLMHSLGFQQQVIIRLGSIAADGSPRSIDASELEASLRGLASWLGGWEQNMNARQESVSSLSLQLQQISNLIFGFTLIAAVLENRWNGCQEENEAICTFGGWLVVSEVEKMSGSNFTCK